mmetsp:Transcript_3854/g.8975  ORF Transcript_3854/g.8975 Transcript_3854/m.8975 type:complete len:243 (-) Transcript_3854:315-1043(-)
MLIAIFLDATLASWRRSWAIEVVNRSSPAAAAASATDMASSICFSVRSPVPFSSATERIASAYERAASDMILASVESGPSLSVSSSFRKNEGVAGMPPLESSWESSESSSSESSSSDDSSSASSLEYSSSSLSILSPSDPSDATLSRLCWPSSSSSTASAFAFFSFSPPPPPSSCNSSISPSAAAASDFLGRRAGDAVGDVRGLFMDPAVPMLELRFFRLLLFFFSFFCPPACAPVSSRCLE